MADKQSGTGARGNSQHRIRGEGIREQGNHTRTTTDNRSLQVKDTNKSSASNDHASHGRTGTNRR